MTPYAPRRDEIGAFAQALIHHFQLVQSEQQLANQQQQGLSERLARQENFRRESLSFQARIAEIVQQLEGHAGRMSAASGNLMTISSEADARAAASAQSTQRVSGHVDVVASSIRDITATLTEVVGEAERTSAVAAAARSLVAAAKNDVNALTEAARTIDPVIGLIEDVANQTNLLALNATIEAARAGEMGRGFGVVAHEVKQLATRTARATEEVRSGLHGISAASARIVERVAKLVDSIEQVDAVAAAIARFHAPAGFHLTDHHLEHRPRRQRRARGRRRGEGRRGGHHRRQAGRRSCDQGIGRSRPAGRRSEVRGGAVHRDDRKDRRMTMASLPGLPGDAEAQRYAIRSYRMPAKVFHWLTVALVVVLVSSAVIAKQLNDGYWSDTLFMLHKTTGVITLVVVLMRLAYRIAQWWIESTAAAAEPHLPALAALRRRHPCSAAGLGGHFRLRLTRDLPGLHAAGDLAGARRLCGRLVLVPRLSGVRPAGAGGAAHRHRDAGLHDARRRSEAGATSGSSLLPDLAFGALHQPRDVVAMRDPQDHRQHAEQHRLETG